ncbi:DUF4365 domain-containing protein [Candidatus Saccharibacteria bacterium]|nr:MAG: DUF4365 domain-containing protein [Candidatus Saccharibacteria bacterium]
MRFNWLYLQTPLPTRPVRADDSSMLSLDSSFSRDGMNSNWIGSFGEQWFGTMCIASRCIHSKPNQDTAGFDFLVTDQQSETIRVQVKATEQPQWRDGSLAFDLDVATYDKLRQGTTPGFLVVVVLHRRLEVIARHFGRGLSCAPQDTGFGWVVYRRRTTPPRSLCDSPLATC